MHIVCTKFGLFASVVRLHLRLKDYKDDTVVNFMSWEGNEIKQWIILTKENHSVKLGSFRAYLKSISFLACLKEFSLKKIKN